MKRQSAAALLSMALWLVPALAWSASGQYKQTLKLQGITFQVNSPNAGSVNMLHITVNGRMTQKVTIRKEIFGTVTQVEVADLNSDGWPEIYVYVTSAGSGSFGTVQAYAVNRGKSVTPIALPELTDDKTFSQGYMGHDEFAVMENTLARRFPLYADVDSNAKPTGGSRQIHYRLIAGEAGWILRIDPKMTVGL